MRVGLDTNVLAYRSGVGRAAEDRAKQESARAILPQLQRRADLVIPAQVLGELFTVLVRSKFSRAEASAIVSAFFDSFETPAGATKTFRVALEVAEAHQLQFWDSVILATAAEAGCSLFLSEDMQDGFKLLGMTVVNPFAKIPHPSLAKLFAA